MSAATPDLEELSEAVWPSNRPAPQRTVRCRHCGRKNRVQVPAAVLYPERHSCGACAEPLFLQVDESMTGLSSQAYQHTLDRRSLAALKSVPGAANMVRWMLEHVAERGAHLTFMSDAILCDEEQFPELTRLAEQARQRLDVQYKPTIFLGESPHMNAMTTGVKKPVIVVRSALLDQMNDTELVAILGHELGHLQADHPLYQTVAQLLLSSGMTASQILRVMSLPLQRVMRRWTRCAELTADRAALLASRNFAACVGVMLTFAGGNRPGTSTRTKMRLAPFIRQCRELARIQTGYSVDAVLGTYLSLDRTHPNVAWRVTHLIQWVEHGNYLNILSGDYLRRTTMLPPQLPAAS